MNKYSKLTMNEREDISRMLAAGCSMREIAKELERSASTISREINNNVIDIRFYRALFVQQRANKMKHKVRKNRKLIQNPELREIVFFYLSKRWSPEQIAKRLKILYPNDMDMQVSHETIYSYVYILPKRNLRKKLIAYLRRNHKSRRKKGDKPKKGGPIKDPILIKDRPEEIQGRSVPGHWEGDLIIGAHNASAIGTLVERTTRLTMLVKLKNQDAYTVRKAFQEEFSYIPEGLKKTLTYDQGQEMAQHKLFAKETNIIVYFANPHSPWQRGTNENTNSLIRQYFPKGTYFNKISKSQLKRVQDELNDRPRKMHGFYTPHEKFTELLLGVAVAS